MSETKGEKLTIKQIIKNVFYVVSYALKLDRFLVFMVILAFIVTGLVYAMIDTLFVKVFIDYLQDHNKSFAYVIVFVCCGILVLGLAQLMEVVVDNWARAKFMKTVGKIQAEFIQKAADIDLICYDHKEYFDDFVIAAAQAEDMIIQGVMSTAYISEFVTSILGLTILVSSISPVIAIFPLLGFTVNIITRFKITKLEYIYEVEEKRIMRKADYSKRVFYQPEYAKEIKLSAIDIPLRKQMNEAIDELSGKAKNIGIKIAILSLINWISVYTLCSYFFVPMYLGYYALVKHSLSLGDVTAMTNATNNIRDRLDNLNYVLVDCQRVGQYAERFRRFINYEVKIENHVGKLSVPSGKQALEIRNMSFRYEGAKKDTLKNINMVVKPGERIAIVGENGAGKTTFVKLLMRLYDVTEGGIYYGSHDIREYTTKEYRDIFGAVFQDFQIYGTTLAENVLMGKANSNDEQRIRNALDQADFTQKLATLKNGLQTQMTREFVDDGTMLSGGESQKVAISRMFAKDKKMSIAILDEPSSALDPFAEYKLNKNMMESAKDASIIFISHRLSTTRDADCIYMFEQGEIIEHGTHEELMKLNGKYALMFERQAHYYQEEV